MPTYKVTQQVVDLMVQLKSEGYCGKIELINSSNTYTGVIDIVGENVMMFCVDGFCKEQLHVVEDIDTGNILLVGRYSLEMNKPNVSVSDIVMLSWDMYKTYKESGYRRPTEFELLYRKYGYLRTVTKTIKEDIEL